MRTLGRWADRLLEHLLALVEVEQGLALLGVAQGGHHHLVEQPGTPARPPRGGRCGRGRTSPGRGRPSRARSLAERVVCGSCVGVERATVTSVPPYRRDLVTTQPPARRSGRDDSSTAMSARSEPSSVGPLVEGVRRVAEGQVEAGRAGSSHPGSSARDQRWPGGPASPTAARLVRTASRAAAIVVDEGGTEPRPATGPRHPWHRCRRTGRPPPARRPRPSSPRMSKMASRTRSEVGRTRRGSRAGSRRPRLVPPITRIAHRTVEPTDATTARTGRRHPDRAAVEQAGRR